jgi:hypothetical protein
MASVTTTFAPWQDTAAGDHEAQQGHASQFSDTNAIDHQGLHSGTSAEFNYNASARVWPTDCGSPWGKGRVKVSFRPWPGIYPDCVRLSKGAFCVGAP